MAKLTVYINDKPSRIYRINKRITVGRDAANEVQILDQKVSRRHLCVEKKKGYFILRDLGSRNGTFLNDVRVQESELKTGDRIRLGNTRLSFGEEPIVDSVQDTDTGDLEIPGASGSDPVIYQYDPHKLKDLAERVSQQHKMKSAIRLLAEIIAFAGHIRTFESSSIIFQSIQDIVHEMLPVERSFILLKAKNNRSLNNVAVRSTLQTTHQPDFENPVFRRVHEDGQTLYSRKGFETGDTQNAGAFKSASRSAVCAPLKSGSKIMGMIYADMSGGADSISTEDVMILSALAGIAGTQIDEWQSRQELNERLLSSLRILSDIAEDTFEPQADTRGRSARVAGRARMIAEYMGLPEDQMELITAASFITSMMTCRNAPLSMTDTLPEDRNDGHGKCDRYILKMETMPGMTEIARIVKHRNENLDGSGSPEGLSGNAIPLGSRIIRAVLLLEEVDTTDPAMMEASLNHFSGSMLDPLVVRALKQCATRLIGIYRPGNETPGG